MNRDLANFNLEECGIYVIENLPWLIFAKQYLRYHVNNGPKTKYSNKYTDRITIIITSKIPRTLAFNKYKGLGIDFF